MTRAVSGERLSSGGAASVSVDGTTCHFVGLNSWKCIHSIDSTHHLLSTPATMSILDADYFESWENASHLRHRGLMHVNGPSVIAAIPALNELTHKSHGA